MALKIRRLKQPFQYKHIGEVILLEKKYKKNRLVQMILQVLLPLLINILVVIKIMLNNIAIQKQENKGHLLSIRAVLYMKVNGLEILEMDKAHSFGLMELNL